MDELPEKPAASAQGASERGLRLDSWKEIAAHLKRDVRTVQRWEKTASLPVRRLHKPGLRARLCLHRRSGRLAPSAGAGG